MKSSCCNQHRISVAGGRSGRSLRSACTLEWRCLDTLADMVVKPLAWRPCLVMSNGGFGGIHQKLLDGLAKKAEAAQ